MLSQHPDKEIFFLDTKSHRRTMINLDIDPMPAPSPALGPGKLSPITGQVKFTSQHCQQVI